MTALTQTITPRSVGALSERAFMAWLDPHLPVMAALAARLAPAERDDVVQQAVALAWAKRTQFDPDRGTPAAWLLAITANEARRTYRRRRTSALVADVPATVRPLDDALDLEAAITRLSPRQRLAVDCHYFAGLTVDETAAIMGCASGTVKSTLSDARGRLRELLEVER